MRYNASRHCRHRRTRHEHEHHRGHHHRHQDLDEVGEESRERADLHLAGIDAEATKPQHGNAGDVDHAALTPLDHSRQGRVRQPQRGAHEDVEQALANGNRLQDILTAEFAEARTGNEILAAALAQADLFDGIEGGIGEFIIDAAGGIAVDRVLRRVPRRHQAHHVARVRRARDLRPDRVRLPPLEDVHEPRRKNVEVGSRVPRHTDVVDRDVLTREQEVVPGQPHVQIVARAEDVAETLERGAELVAAFGGNSDAATGPEACSTGLGARGCEQLLVVAGGACSGNGILLDISDPVNPRRINEVSDPNFAYWHSATFSNDGTKVLFTDEWGGGSRPRCRAYDPLDWGADAIYDIVDNKLEFRSYFKMPAPQVEQENCVAHNGAIIPVPGRDIFVQAWYQGGISVIDFTDSANPVEIAYFDRGPIDAEKLVLGGYWSSYWYSGKIYATEIYRGLDVFDLVPSEYLSANEIAAATYIAP